jgi:hypothetical protein
MTRQLKCPVCGSVLQKVRFGEPFRCSGCGERLKVPAYYGRIAYLVALLLSGLLSAAVGFEGIALFFATVVLSFPLVFLLAGPLSLIVPPKIGRYVPEHFTLFPR